MAAYEFTVTVRTQYLPEQSDPARTNFVFTYSITIKNTGTIAAQLVSRHWVITDAANQTQEVRGLGVVGHPHHCLHHVGREPGDLQLPDDEELHGCLPWTRQRPLGSEHARRRCPEVSSPSEGAVSGGRGGRAPCAGAAR